MKHFFLFALPFCLFSSIYAQNTTERLSSFQITSEILNETRSCLLSLPASYSENTDKEYPLLILLDGRAHFSVAVEISDFLSSSNLRHGIIPEIIIVAIENVDRERDFTHTKLQTTRENTMGGGRNFLAFIEQELFPYVDQQYRTNDQRMLSGHSLGGQLAINAFRDSGSLFDGFIALDPALWWDEAVTKDRVESIDIESFEKPLFIATANQNPARAERNKAKHDLLFQLLQEKSESTFKVDHMIFDDENHRSVPLLGLYYGLKYVLQ